MPEFAAVLALLPVAVYAHMRWQAWRDTRNPTPAMKRGDRPRWVWWLPAAPVVVTAVWWGLGFEVARVLIAVSAGAPWLFVNEKFWIRRAQ